MGRRRIGKGKKQGGAKSSPRWTSSDQDNSNGSDRISSIDVDTPLTFEIGTRVELPNLPGYAKKSSPHTGTVAGLWERRDHWPRGVVAPYLVLLDDGTAFYCLRSDTEFLRETDVPAMRTSLNIGCRVECQLEANNPKWFPGTIIQVHHDWAMSPIDTPPYYIRFDYGRERPFWGPGDRIRKIECKKKCQTSLPLRFEIGDRVICSMDDDWMPGQIVRRWYREDDFENGHAVPYQVLLDTGDFIYAPSMFM
ncbi:hypothetical protein ACHAXR_000426, partial [Thalassiosira sp. AJA248-18]